jgi:type VII secretion protein EccB
MASRRDQLQAYRYLHRRHAAALLDASAEARPGAEPAEAPLRRMSGGVVGSVVVALLVLAGVGLYGLISPGGATGWRDGKSVILERETGTRYVYLGDTLHPVLNYASARLILHTGALISVARSSLGQTPRGAPVGIPGAPDSLPSPATLVTGAWTVCSAPAADPSGRAHPLVTVRPSAVTGTVVPPSSGVLVRDQQDEEFLIWNGSRLRVPDGGAVPAALGYAATAALPVGDAWVNAVAQGPDLRAPSVPAAGASGPPLGGRATAIGQLFATGDGGAYLMLPDGLAPISALQRHLLLASPAIAASYKGAAATVLPLSDAELAQAPRSATSPATTPGLPTQPPALVDAATTSVAICASLPGGNAAATISTTPTPARTVPSGTGIKVDGLGVPIADAAALTAGQGAVVRAEAPPGANTGTVYLVSDLGIRFPVAGKDVLSDLGLGGATPTPLPSGWINLFPLGPTLDEKAAAQMLLPGQPPSSSPPA